MIYRLLIPTLVSTLICLASCNSQEAVQENASEKELELPVEQLGPVVSKKIEPHRYGGWYCPDNFGFVPVDIQKLNEVPAVANRLPTQHELDNNMSLIKVDTAKYPEAKALEMDLPRVASIYSEGKGITELVIVIQALVIQEDTVVGYRFVNGGNGSAWLTDITFLTEAEVAGKGAQPFYYAKSVLKASTKDIWHAMSQTDFFTQLGEKFGKETFFSSELDLEAQAHLELNTSNEKATGYAGMVYGNFYLQIDYDRNGFHYSEKILLMENRNENTTEFFFASGPYPQGFNARKQRLDKWVAEVVENSELTD